MRIAVPDTTTRRMKLRNIPNVHVFNGTSTYVALGTGNLVTGNATWSGWLFVPRSSEGTNRTIIAKRATYTSSTMTYQISLTSANFFIGRNGSSANFSTYGLKYPKNQWFHFAITRDATNAKLYINGQLVDTQATFTFGTGTTAPLMIGANSTTPTEFFKGMMSDIRVHNSALTLAQIQEIYYENKQPADPIYWYKLDEGTGATATDSSVTANNGTITDGAWATTTPIKSRPAKSGRVLATGRVAI